MRTFIRLTGAVAVAAVFAACSGDFANDLVAPEGANHTEVEQTGWVKVYKIGPEGTYEFMASESPETGSLLHSDFQLGAYDNLVIWSTTDPSVTSDVTIAELEDSGTQLDSIVVRTWVGTAAWRTKYTDTREVELEGLDYNTIVRVKFYNSEAPGGGEGCTPGFWRQPHHFDSWVGYAPIDLYDDVFGVTYGGSLLDAVWANGGGVDALARHSVAALLNASSPDVDYPYTTGEVIDAVQNAFMSDNFEDTKDMFEGWNEAGCMLD